MLIRITERNSKTYLAIIHNYNTAYIQAGFTDQHATYIACMSKRLN